MNLTVEVTSVARPNFVLDPVSIYRVIPWCWLRGCWIPALVVFEGITGHDARSLPAEAMVGGRTLSLPAGRVRLLQQAAHKAVARFHSQ